MSYTESFTTSSGKEIEVSISDEGEPTGLRFAPDPDGGAYLSENELLEIAEWFDEYDSDDSEEN